MASYDLVQVIKTQAEFTVMAETKYNDWIQTLQQMYQQWILSPLARLYLWGPTLGGWGFWGGMDMADICAQKTTLGADFWKKNSEQCAHLVTKQFYSLTVLVETLTYFYGVYFLYKYVFLYLMKSFVAGKKSKKKISPPTINKTEKA